MRNRFKRLLKEGKVTFGLWITIDSTDIAEIISKLGFDWLVFDMEHAPLTIKDIQKMIQVINDSEVTPLVRVAWNDPVLVKLVLDVGVHGILFPWISSREEAELAVKSTKYPPKGIRGYGPRRASMYGLKIKEYLASADEEVMVIAQIETRKAIENLNEILSVKGVDAIFIGPYDLATSLGYLGDPSHPEVQEAIKNILEKALKHNVPAGIYIPPEPELALKYIDMGFKFIALGSDVRMLISACTKVLGEIESKLKV